jgi:acyl-CoA synthetase (NDP forming)
VGELIEKYQKPVFAVGANLVKGKGGAQTDFILPQFRTPERAARAAGMLYRYSRYRRSIKVI